MTQHYGMLQRNLLYTGVTRRKKLVVLVGQTKAVAIAVKNETGRRRLSKLNEWLQCELSRLCRVLELTRIRIEAAQSKGPLTDHRLI
jgi:exodeoxyribonuclease V alpha subunit